MFFCLWFGFFQWIPQVNFGKKMHHEINFFFRFYFSSNINMFFLLAQFSYLWVIYSLFNSKRSIDSKISLILNVYRSLYFNLILIWVFLWIDPIKTFWKFIRWFSLSLSIREITRTYFSSDYNALFFYKMLISSQSRKCAICFFNGNGVNRGPNYDIS